MVMSRWDPFSEALSLREAMNHLFEQAVLQPSSGSQGRQSLGFAPALDVSEDKDEYCVRANLPGVKPEDVNIELERGVLTISGEIHDEWQRDQQTGQHDGQSQTQQRQGRQQGTHHIRERRFGRFYRSITLPTDVDANKADASFEHGVLTLRIPKTEATKPRRIQVRPADSQSGTRQIEGTATRSPAESSASKGDSGSSTHYGGSTRQEMPSTRQRA